MTQQYAKLTGLGVDPESTQKVKDLRARLATEVVDVGGLERGVYDHLYSFFRRYYSEGDYRAMRVNFRLVYAAEGEHGKLKAAEGEA